MRGLYVVALAVKDRNYRDYKIALWMGFWKYIGYLSFPLQMAYHYPAIARFMAGRWATGAVHVLPVFGESGALAEHAAFDLFYNRPLTIRRRLAAWAVRREGLRPRRWHAPLIAAAAWCLIAQPVTVIGLIGYGRFVPDGSAWRLMAAGMVAGWFASRLAGGAGWGARIFLGAMSALGMALVQIVVVAAPGLLAGEAGTLWPAVQPILLPAFATTLLGLLAAAVAELTLPNPPTGAKDPNTKP